MDLAQRIQAKTDNGDTIIDFLVEVMTDQLDHFKMNHRLQAARLLTRYGCSCKSALAQRDEGIAFILNNLPEPSLDTTGSSSSDNSEFDQALAKKIRESTDDGTTVCRFLINVMDGELKQLKPHHRISAARELLSRGFGKHPGARASRPHKEQRPPLPAGEGWGEGEKTEGRSTPSHSSPSPQPTKSEKSPNPINHSSDCCEEDVDWDEINEIVDTAIEESNRKLAEQPESDSDNLPYKPDYSAFDEALENSDRWFEEWKNSIDPDEYHAIIKETSERFDAKIDLRFERRKQIRKDREQREKEEAERQVQQAKARTKAKEKAEVEEAERKKEEELGPPPDRDEHERWSPTPSIPTSFRLVNCGHPKCKLHDGPVYYPEDDRNSPYYWNGQQPFTFR